MRAWCNDSIISLPNLRRGFDSSRPLQCSVVIRSLIFMKSIGFLLVFLIICVVVGFFVWKLLSKFKMPKLACVNLVTGRR